MYPKAFIRLFLLVVALVTGTASVRAAEPQWVEVRSPNFSVLTDAGDKRGREVALRFEQMRKVFGTLILKEKVNLPVPLQIIAFRNRKQMRNYAPLFNGKPIELAGFFQMGEDRNFIALDLSSADPYHTVFHEYAHLLLNGNFPRTALWFDEGFAEYYATIRISGKQVYIGDAEEGKMEYLRDKPINTLQLFSILHESKEYNVTGDQRSAYYAHAWLMVHYLFDAKKLKEASAYLDLTQNQNVPIAEAIQRAFGMDAKTLDKTVDNFYRSGKLLMYTTKAPEGIKDFEFTAHPASPSDAQATLADMHLHSLDYQDEAIAEFESVLKADPENASAHRGLGYAHLRRSNFDRARDHFRRAAALNSNDARVHYYSALLMSREGLLGGSEQADELAEMKNQLQKAIALDPQFADSYNLLAVACSSSGDMSTAIESIRKALELNPRNEYYRLNLAQYLLRTESWDEASTILQQLKNSTEPMVASAAQNFLDALKTMRRFKDERAQAITEIDRKAVAAGESNRSNDEFESDRAIEIQAASNPINFLKGKLVAVECPEDGSAALTVVSGKTRWQMRTNDRNKLVVIGADAFSCDWKNRPVAVNYRRSGDGQGDMVSLELQ